MRRSRSQVKPSQPRIVNSNLPTVCPFPVTIRFSTFLDNCQLPGGPSNSRTPRLPVPTVTEQLHPSTPPPTLPPKPFPEMATTNWRTINIDLLDPDSPANFDNSSLLPSVPSISTQEVQTLSGQIKQLLRGGDSEGALRGALENAPYGGDVGAKVSPNALHSLCFSPLQKSNTSSRNHASR